MSKPNDSPRLPPVEKHHAMLISDWPSAEWLFEKGNDMQPELQNENKQQKFLYKLCCSLVWAIDNMPQDKSQSLELLLSYGCDKVKHLNYLWRKKLSNGRCRIPGDFRMVFRVLARLRPVLAVFEQYQESKITKFDVKRQLYDVKETVGNQLYRNSTTRYKERFPELIHELVVKITTLMLPLTDIDQFQISEGLRRSFALAKETSSYRPKLREIATTLIQVIKDFDRDQNGQAGDRGLMLARLAELISNPSRNWDECVVWLEVEMVWLQLHVVTKSRESINSNLMKEQQESVQNVFAAASNKLPELGGQLLTDHTIWIPRDEDHQKVLLARPTKLGCYRMRVRAHNGEDDQTQLAALKEIVRVLEDATAVLPRNQASSALVKRQRDYISFVLKCQTQSALNCAEMLCQQAWYLLT